MATTSPRVPAGLRLPDLTAADLTIVPANQASWEDLQAVFGVRGYTSTCQCQRFKLGPYPWRESSVAVRQERLRRETHCGFPSSPTTSGLVAYLDGEPVGWCAVEPRSAYKDLPWQRTKLTVRGEDPADRTVWAVTCFATRAGHRRRGISRVLAAAAVEFARERGARAVEAYPMITEPGVEITWGETHVGTRSIFEAAGMTEVLRASLRRVVMRIDLEFNGRPPDRQAPDETAVETPMSAPIILVPGFWLGAWAWDKVAEKLRADGHDVTALTLPGLESADADRSSIHFADHVDAIVRAIEVAAAPVILAVHSATGFSGYAASDRVPDRIAAMVYVDTAPGKPPLDPDFADVEKPLVWDALAAEENLDGLSEAQLAEFRERAVPVPGALLREGYEFTNDARLDIPSTIIATGYSAADYRTYAKEHPEWSFLAGIPELHDITWIDLPTSHWPMWSRPAEVAEIIGAVATKAGAAHAAGASR